MIPVETVRPPRRLHSWTWAAFLIVLIEVPFLLARHIQEDAYITIRTAAHLADYGDFSYNLHQRFPATTSLLYPVLLAAMKLALGSHLVLGIQLFGVACLVVGSYLVSRTVSEAACDGPAVWLLVACWPTALLMASFGMETSLLILVLGGALYALGRDAPRWVFPVSLSLLPLIRPDAIAYGAVLCAGMWFVERRRAASGAAGVAAGAAVFCAANWLLSGHALPTTAAAKEIAYHPSHAPGAVLGRVWQVFVGQSFLLPVSTAYLARFGFLLVLAVAGAFVLCFRRSASRRQTVVLATLMALIVLLPAIYAAGGVIFDWYLYPANWLASLVLAVACVGAIRRLQRPWLARACVAMLWTGAISLQWAKCISYATDDRYSADVGRYLGEVSQGKGTLFLEPAGYIPYFSKLPTDDEVGLVSPRVTPFMLRYPGNWWIQFVEKVQPTYLVQREGFSHFQTFQGYSLSPEERTWFLQHYRLLRRMHFNPADYHTSPLLIRVCRFDKMQDYLIYEKAH